ncbi:MAG: hypothetical protein R3E66_19720 [bacterium]
MNSTIKTAAKLAMAGTTIAAIGFAMVTFGGSKAPVKEAEADILALDFAPKSKSEKFVDSLKDLGMEKPRVYDWNGNSMYFSTMTTDRTPTEVLRDFQQKFVENGVNRAAHTTPVVPAANYGDPKTWKDLPPAKRKEAVQTYNDYLTRSGDFFGGGMVPTAITPNYVAMSGMESKKSAEDGFDFFKELKAKGSKRLTDSVGSARYIEAFKEGGRTRVTATWTGEDVDFNKFRNVGDDVGTTDKVPACVGCERLMRFVGKSEKEYATNVYNSSQSRQQVVDFYERSLGERGWRVAPATEAMRNAKAQGIMPDEGADLVSFARGGEFMTLLVYPTEDGKTGVQVVESP